MKKNSFIYIFAGFAATFSLLVIFSLISWERLTALIQNSDQIEQSQKTIEYLERLGNYVRDAETSVRGYALIKDSIYLDHYLYSKAEIPKAIDSLKSQLSNSNLQKARLGILNNTVQLRMQVLEMSIQRINSNTFGEVKEEWMARGRFLMEEFRKEIIQIESEEKRLLKESYNLKLVYQRITPNMFRKVFALVVLTSLGLFVFVLKEMFQRLRFQSELQNQVQALRQSNNELTQLAFAASHDLKEPVRKMRTFSEILLKKQSENLGGEGKMILDRIDHSARRLEGMLDDISWYMNLIDSNEKRTLVSTRKIVEEAVQSFSGELRNKKGNVQFNQLPDIEAFPTQCSILFKALIDNSLKFSKPTEAPSIFISGELVDNTRMEELGYAHMNRNFYSITIKDNGIGFDNEFRTKIFQLFRQLHSPENIGGKGIGLAICKRVMTNHNGFIIADSKPGEGATFTLYFPA